MAVPKTLKRWSAKRSGKGITVHGDCAETGAAVKLTHVESIDPPSEVAANHVVATDENGNQHRLLLN